MNDIVAFLESDDALFDELDQMLKNKGTGEGAPVRATATTIALPEDEPNSPTRDRRKSVGPKRRKSVCFVVPEDDASTTNVESVAADVAEQSNVHQDPHLTTEPIAVPVDEPEEPANASEEATVDVSAHWMK